MKRIGYLSAGWLVSRWGLSQAFLTAFQAGLAEMHWVEGADHSFHVPKSSGKTDEQVLDGIGDAVDKWVGRLSAG